MNSPTFRIETIKREDLGQELIRGNYNFYHIKINHHVSYSRDIYPNKSMSRVIFIDIFKQILHPSHE